MPDGSRRNNQLSNISNILTNVLSFFKIRTKKGNNASNLNINNISESEIQNDLQHYEKLTAEDIMIPRTDIIGVELSSSLDDIKSKFLKTRHTRMPVYKGELDNTIGYINIKDFLPFVFNNHDRLIFKLEEIVRDILVVPQSMKIFNLIEKMKQNRTHIALVVDELGGVDGLITIEDLVEEIIGKIEDEHDQDQSTQLYKKINNKTYEISARMEIEELESLLDIRLNSEEISEDYDTIGGLILSISSYVPNKGDKIVHPDSNIVFEIIDSDPRRIKTIRLHLP